MNLNSILIGSEDPQRLTEYYTRLFGKPGWDDGGYTGWQLGTGGITVGPHDHRRTTRRIFARAISFRPMFDEVDADIWPGRADRRGG
jgi:hypothetical protein